MILYGRNAVREALRGRRAASVEGVWATATTARESWLSGLAVRERSAAEIERRCGSPAHQGVCAQAGGYPYVSAEELLRGATVAGRPGGAGSGAGAAEVVGEGHGGSAISAAGSAGEDGGPEPLIVALDEIQDPQNLGSICRTAECVGATGVVIPERRAAEVTPAACKASAGALEHLRVARVRNLADFLARAKDAGCWCYGASAPRDAPAEEREPGLDGGTASATAASAPASTPTGWHGNKATALALYDEPDYRGAGTVLVLGSESRGLRPRVAGACDQLIALPLHGRVGSLGVSAAAAAILYEILQNRSRPA